MAPLHTCLYNLENAIYLEAMFMNPLRRLKILFLVLLIAGTAVRQTKAETPDVMALATLDRFMAAFNHQNTSKPGPKPYTTLMFDLPAVR